ncbi:MAG: carboxylating nicotinate-nucleotide diphosphorylase [Bacteroidales bacterium]|jgi:nicotinate-nucleotide pyrophosphorylase (carboxylating)|nr:carboxylating nicotinate-nucleotide diphosphorylase [Bacteroidales bacterium]
MNTELIDRCIELAIAEDIGDGDHSSLSCLAPDKKGVAKLYSKDTGVIAGIDIAERIFTRFNSDLKFISEKSDGDKIMPGELIFTVEGAELYILQAERLVLNVMQRMSGIATQTKYYVNLLDGLNTQILDTRKTTPGFRAFEKEAVRIGGGTNHRFGLYDMIMLKDNHIDFSGGIEKAIDAANSYINAKGKSLKIEVETRSVDDVKRVLKHGGVQRIMLDNFSIDETIEAVKIIDGKIETESSGGITAETIRSYAECGVDFISVGALTHQVKSLDMSLKVEM